MTNIEYFKYAIKKRLLHRLKFFFSTMSINPSDNEYLKIKDKYYFVNIDGNEVKIDNVTIDRPLLHIYDDINITKDDMVCVKDKVDTTIGLAIANYLLVEYPFKGKIEYKNEKFGIGDLEKKISPDWRNGKITTDEYIVFTDASSLLQGISKLVTIAATYKNIVAPTDIAEFKKKVDKYMIDNYGKEWRKDQLSIVIYKKILMAYDKEYMKDDPTFGKLVSGKVVDNARPRMYQSFGTDVGFAKPGDDLDMVDNSLDEGYPKDKVQLAALFNSSRAGSYYRGHETQKGGQAAKDILRAGSGVTVIDTDCGSNVYKELFVTKDITDNLDGRYMKQGSGIIKIEKASDLVGQTILIRSPMFCKLKGKKMCATCCGENLRGRDNSIPILFTNISAAILTSSLKRMHNTGVKSMEFNILDAIN